LAWCRIRAHSSPILSSSLAGRSHVRGTIDRHLRTEGRLQVCEHVAELPCLVSSLQLYPCLGNSCFSQIHWEFSTGFPVLANAAWGLRCSGAHAASEGKYLLGHR